MPSLDVNFVLSTMMSSLYLRLTRTRRSTSSCSFACVVANGMMLSAERRFVNICSPICSPPVWLHIVRSCQQRPQIMTGNFKKISFAQHESCVTHIVHATLTLASCFLYSLASKQSRAYHAFLKSTSILFWNACFQRSCSNPFPPVRLQFLFGSSLGSFPEVVSCLHVR